MQEGVIRDKQNQKVIMWVENQQSFMIPMQKYQIPFFSAGERVYFDARTGYCFRKEQPSPTRYALGLFLKLNNKS